MKVKQVLGPSRSESPGQSPSQFDESPQQTRPLSSTSNNSGTFIWTRSAAFRAAQQHKLAHDTAHSCHPGKHRQAHQHHQHVLGKIVKPIPVRPMSSSSSSSSNHSSSLSNSIHLRTGESNAAAAANNSGGGFSLIAKYFASFPATRLAKTSTQMDAAAATPFLPFKKPPSECKPEPIQSTFVLRSHQASTDHLCTNFRRMIKLNEHELPASPLRTAQTSPFTSGNTPTTFEPLNYCFDSSKDEQSLDSVEERNQAHDSHETSRFGQITMETRSTRRFLIKHHPYLKLNSSSSSNSIDNQVRSQMGRNKSANDSQRPSINLMKKLSSRKPVESVGNVPIDLNRSGRSSRSNNSGLNEPQPLSADYSSLVKFIDTAPLAAKPAKVQQQTSTSKRRQSRTLTTAAALSTEINSMSKTNKPKASDDDLLDCCDYCCLNANDSECLDEQEEDSSGYYSSYHSADLVSSSGGSCGGYNHCSNSNTAKEAAASVTMELNKANVPQHHYHTRYLSQFLNQDMHEHAATKSNLIPATPTTRLRSGRKSGMDNYNLGCELDLDQIEND